ncbi:hypothetical protein LTR35_012808 [Friedmanniomyces endolithicus]|nr:hypothetical protein LTR35_012808 [Friedmanniomyces endolithicus]KAK0297436.1 hypothetical protein LTS00_004159 [Friedmanniomyces endolithicus]KAK0311394.1 hypothetical protein LTR01_003390 [Friedmanniomyces endolithicus]KAK0828598.1 hypothetical protein LTR73_004907 [Friedmanniomyces endolithicus]KAK0989006.1 hypothetical protein LTR54_012582 [Friedmanniomyces endolithicus]
MCVTQFPSKLKTNYTNGGGGTTPEPSSDSIGFPSRHADSSKMDTDTRPHPTPKDDDDLLSPLEQEVLDAYAKLAGNLDNVLSLAPKPSLKTRKLTSAGLADNPSVEILDALRGLERKTSTVFTLLKASVYSIVLQQEIFGDEGEGEGLGHAVRR